MAYDEGLAGQLRDLLHEEPAAAGHELTEKKMFGGLAFLVDGHMALAASGRGVLMVRIDPAHGEELLAATSARPMQMQGRSLSGWVEVDLGEAPTDDQLAPWVTRGAAFAASLPPK